MTFNFAGADRITFTTNDVVVDQGMNVRRTRTYAWNVLGVNSTNLVSVNESSVDGLQGWQIAFNAGNGVTNHSQTVYGTGGYRYVSTTAPDGTQRINTYQYGRLIASVTTNTTLGQLAGTTYAYDSHGRLGSTVDARNGTTTTTYNSGDPVASTQTPAPGTGASAQTTLYFYDLMGRDKATELPDSTWVTNVYTLMGQIQQTYGSRQYPVAYGYDGQGRMTSMMNWANAATGAGARVTSWGYDGYRGWLVGKAYPAAPTNGPAYTYTAAGRLQTRQWARGTTTTYTYDANGSLTNVAYSDGVTPTVGYAYDRLGRQISIANGTATANYTLNDAGQVLTEAYTGGPQNGWAVTNGYDALLRRTNLVTLYGGVRQTVATNNYDAASRMGTISDGTNSATYSFLANSPLVSQIVFQNNGATRMTTTKTYDYLNRLTQIASTPSASPVISFAYAYNNANQRTSVTNADGTYWLYGYDALAQVTSGVKYFNNGVPVPGEQFGYAFDNIGNRTSTTAGGDQNGGNLRTATYGANLNNQYTNRMVPGAVDILGSAVTNATVTVKNQATYRNGTFYEATLALANTSAAVWQSVTNLAVAHNSSTTDLVATVTGNTFLQQTPEAFSYDSDGNLTQDGRWTYTWDAENRLIQMVNLTNAPTASKLRLTFAYDSKWRRISKAVEAYNGTSWTTNLAESFVYDGWNLVDELNATNNVVIRSYLWGLDVSGTLQGAGGAGGLLAMDQPGSTSAKFVAFDGNANLVGLVAAEASVQNAAYEYEVFGEVLHVNSAPAYNNPIRFSTKYQDAESGLLYYGHRYLDTLAGRWQSRDPIGENGGFNPYSFVNNSPFSSIDLKGLITVRTLTTDPQTDCGSYDVKWNFILDHAAAEDGYIVQKVVFQGEWSSCVRGVSKNRVKPYWEAWLVKAGSQWATGQIDWNYTDNGADSKNYGTKSKIPKGQTGEIKFFYAKKTGNLGDPAKGPAKPDSITGWNPGSKTGTSGYLASTENEPSWWKDSSDGGEASATRSVLVTWDCCCGKERIKPNGTLIVTPY